LGFTLLEIILALAILAGSLAALGEVMRSADQSAGLTGDETEAQIIAASIMDELVAGARTLQTVNRAPYDSISSPPWLVTVELADTGLSELVAVHVRVEQDLEARLQPARFELVRWLPNSNNQSASTSDDSSDSSTSSGSSSSSTGTSSSSAGGNP
jgi:prepilin-type N-terminal cleavage/methylation domain-containing protein